MISLQEQFDLLDDLLWHFLYGEYIDLFLEVELIWPEIFRQAVPIDEAKSILLDIVIANSEDDQEGITEGVTLLRKKIRNLHPFFTISNIEGKAKEENKKYG